VERAELISKYRWVRDFSFPRRFPLVQFPNDPLILAFLAGELAGRLHGSGHDYASAVSYLAMSFGLTRSWRMGSTGFAICWGSSMSCRRQSTSGARSVTDLTSWLCPNLRMDVSVR
jgi:hypothetical protein